MAAEKKFANIKANLLKAGKYITDEHIADTLDDYLADGCLKKNDTPKVLPADEYSMFESKKAELNAEYVNEENLQHHFAHFELPANSLVAVEGIDAGTCCSMHSNMITA